MDNDDAGDACDPDIDGDGALNGCEQAADPDAMCPLECELLCPDTLPDCTGCAPTDPFDPDTDDGGVSDGDELTRGTNPLDPVDDPLPGVVTGGGVFYCGVGRDAPSPSPWPLLLVGAALVVRRRR